MQTTFEQLNLFSEYTVRNNYKSGGAYYEISKNAQVSACIRYNSKVALRVSFEFWQRHKASEVLSRIAQRLNDASDKQAKELLISLQKSVKDYEKTSISIKKIMLFFTIS